MFYHKQTGELITEHALHRTAVRVSSGPATGNNGKEDVSRVNMMGTIQCGQ